MVSIASDPTSNREFQKNSKKFQKNKKNTIMDSFQAKIGWKRSRKRKKNYRFDPFQPDEY